MDWLNRQELLIGSTATEILKNSTVAVLGLGGVGGACAEALCRAGVGRLILLDSDRVELSNLNRQLFATRDTVGMLKTEAAMKRLSSISDFCEFLSLPIFYSTETAEELFALNPDYVIDCIDTVTAKLHLAESCRERSIPLLMCLGTGNRLDPGQFVIGDLYETANVGGCGLARVMRREMKKRGFKKQKVLYSKELPRKAAVPGREGGRSAPGSISFCPPAAGFLLAGAAVRDLIGEK